MCSPGILSAQLCALAFLILTFDSPIQSQTFRWQLQPSWLPAAQDSGPVVFSTELLPPSIYSMLSAGTLAVRWNQHFFPVGLYLANNELQAAFSIPASACTPGLIDVVLWNTASQQPLPYRAWVPVVLPARGSLFEANPSVDRVVVAVGTNAPGTAGEGDAIQMFQLSTGKLIQTIKLSAPQRVVALTPDTKYAWVVRDDSHGRIARLNLASRAFDESLQVNYPTPANGPPESTIWGAQVYRQDPRILLVATGNVGFVLEYVDGVLVNNGPATNWQSNYPLVLDDTGRLMIASHQLCEISATAGFTNCQQMSVPSRVLPTAVWRDKYLDNGGTVHEIATGQVVGTLLDVGALYLPESDRLFFDGRFADGTSLETYTRLISIDFSPAPTDRIWAPDWMAAQTEAGILIAHVPQLLPLPSFPVQGLVDAATNQSGPIAAGEILSIYGQNLGPATGAGPVIESGLQLSSDVEQTSVLFDGAPGSILFAGSDQINAIAPESVAGSNSVSVQVVHYGIPSARVPVPAASYAPGLFSYAVQGKSYLAALAPSGVLESPAAPLARGKVATFWGTGLGLPTGQDSASIPGRAAELPLLPTISIQGHSLPVLYAGASPGLTAALAQINVQIPADSPTGDALEVQISIDGQNQQTGLVAIQ
jgi:uncharacterized protein (TIGR03437 family)